MVSLPALLGLLVATAALASAAPAQDSTAGFRLELEDANGNPVSYPAASAAGPSLPTVTVIVVADREGAAGSRGWGEALGGRYSDRLRGETTPGLSVLAVAHLESVPALLRGFVRRSFRDAGAETSLPIALDWRGQAAGQLDFVSGVPNLAVVDPGGAIRLQLAAWPSDVEARRRLYAALDDLFAG